MAVLNVIVTDLLIGQRLVSLGQLDESVVECLDGLVLGGVRSDLVGVIDERKALVVSRNRFFVGTLSTNTELAYSCAIDSQPWTEGRSHAPLKYPRCHMDPKSWELI